MTYSKQDASFFEELEAAAKSLAVASDGQSSEKLKQLFDDLKETMRRENTIAIVSHEDAICSVLQEGRH